MAGSRELRYQIVGDARDFNRTLQSIDGRLDRSEKRFRHFGVGVLGAMSVVPVVGLGKAMVKTASDINESLTKNRVLFGQYARDVEAFSKTSAASFGISRAAALEYTGVFGNLFTAVGASSKESARFSVTLTKLAADMASFNNTSVDDALEAIRSGLVGETEPLRRFGVNLNDAQLRQQALALGLTKTTKNVLTPYQRAMAAQALIVKQTEKAHGDFKRTQSGAANQSRILNAQIKDLSGELGKSLLPVVRDVVSGLNRFVKGFREGKGAGGQFRDTLKEIVDRVKPIVTFFKDHPKLIAVAVGAWAAYKTASLAALAVINVGRFRRAFAKSVPVAATQGTAAGTAYATSFEATAAAGIGRAGGKTSKLGKATRLMGRTLGVVGAAAFAYEFRDSLKKTFDDIGQAVEDAAGNLADLGGSIADDVTGSGSHQDASDVLRPKRPGVIGGAKNKTSNTGAIGEIIGKVSSTGARDPGVGSRPRTRSRARTKVVPETQRARGHAPGFGFGKRQKLPSSSKGVPGGSQGIVALGRWLQSQGFSVSEHPAFGGVHPVHVTNSLHYSGNALDVNADAGGNEDARLSALAAQLTGAGWHVLWHVPDHYDHLHVDTANGNGRIPGSSSSGEFISGFGGGGSGGFSFGGTTTAPAKPKKRRGKVTGTAKAGFPTPKRKLPTQAQRASEHVADLDLAIAMAGLTPDEANDLQANAAKAGYVLSQIASIDQRLKNPKLTVKQRTRLKRKKQGWVEMLSGLLPSPSTSDQEPDTSAADLAAAIADLAAKMDADTKLRAQIFGSQTGQIFAAIADMVSGQIGGRVGLGSQTPSFASGRTRY